MPAKEGGLKQSLPSQRSGETSLVGTVTFCFADKFIWIFKIPRVIDIVIFVSLCLTYFTQFGSL